MTPRFTHLHTHTHHSLLDGLSKIDELVARAQEHGMDSVAITDHGAMYGAIEFYQKAKKAGIKDDEVKAAHVERVVRFFPTDAAEELGL